jgi:hypothetical protein
MRQLPKIGHKNSKNPIDENDLVFYNEATKTVSHVFAEMRQKGGI